MLSKGMCSQTLPTAHVSIVHAKPSLHSALVVHDIDAVKASTPTSMPGRRASGSSLCRAQEGSVPTLALATRSAPSTLRRADHEEKRIGGSYGAPMRGVNRAAIVARAAG
jgi:hypothetical protein